MSLAPGELRRAASPATDGAQTPRARTIYDALRAARPDGRTVEVAGLEIKRNAFTFRFDGRAVAGFAGDTVASALLANGERAGFVSPIAPEDLAGLACEEAALSRLPGLECRVNMH